MRRQIVELERLDVRERTSGLEPRHARNGRVRADVDEHAVADQEPRAAVVQLDLERLRGHEPAGAHDQLGAARLVVVQMRGDLVVDHAALPAANRRHVDLDSPRLRAVLGAVANQRCDLGALDLVLAGQAVDVGTGATNPSSFHDGRPSPRSRHVPRQELATRATAKNQDFNSFRLRHGFLRGDMVSFAILGPLLDRGPVAAYQSTQVRDVRTLRAFPCAPFRFPNPRNSTKSGYATTPAVP